MRWITAPLIGILAACGTMPADPDATSDRVRETRVVRVGIDAGDTQARAAGARALVERIARETGAAPRVTAGALEPLLEKLKNDELDLVVARFAKPTPWESRVSLGPPVAVFGSEEHRLELRAAMRNGENRWIMLVERASRAVAAR